MTAPKTEYAPIVFKSVQELMDADLGKLFAGINLVKGIYFERSKALQSLGKVTLEQLFGLSVSHRRYLFWVLNRERQRYEGTYVVPKTGEIAKLVFPEPKYAVWYRNNLFKAQRVLRDLFYSAEGQALFGQEPDSTPETPAVEAPAVEAPAVEAPAAPAEPTAAEYAARIAALEAQLAGQPARRVRKPKVAKPVVEAAVEPDDLTVEELLLV